jgi:DNA-nicking Smr family endonuclease
VLKTRFEQWITRGMWRCWVAAYASARPADGGTGATVILLRRRRCAKRRGLRS